MDISEKFERRWNFPNEKKKLWFSLQKLQRKRYFDGNDWARIRIPFCRCRNEWKKLRWWQLVTTQSPLKLALECNTINLPVAKPLPGRQHAVPFVCTGDDAFPLSSFMMKPYPRKSWQARNEYLITDFRECGVSRKMVALAAITLHNWLRKDSVYVSRDLVDKEDVETGNWPVKLTSSFFNPLSLFWIRINSLMSR